VRDNILVEQYFLSACIRYHHHHRSSPHIGLEDAYLFASSADAFDPHHSTRAGFTHLIGDAKRDPRIAEKLEQRVKSEYPEHYERCVAYLGSRR